jgi:hypothetical protein
MCLSVKFRTRYTKFIFKSSGRNIVAVSSQRSVSMCCFCVLIHIAFNTFPRTHTTYFVFEKDVLFFCVFKQPSVQRCVQRSTNQFTRPVGRVLWRCFQSHISDLWKLGTGCRTMLDSVPLLQMFAAVRTLFFMDGTLYSQTGHFISNKELTWVHVAIHPYLQRRFHILQQVFNMIFTSILVISKCSNSLTSGHIVWCRFRGYKPVTNLPKYYFLTIMCMK